MTALDRLIPDARLRELDHVDVEATPERAWELVRHGDLARSLFIKALFAMRTWSTHVNLVSLRVDDLRSTVEKPGFQILSDDPPREVAVGAIGKVWHAEIPFVHVADAAGYGAFAEPGFVKVAWVLRVTPRGRTGSRIEIEVRVDATDDASWTKFRAYFLLIGPASRFIRRSGLASIARELGTPAAKENERALSGDDFISDSRAQLTHSIDISASPEAIWPWLVQLGCRRGGFYSLDLLDNGGKRSAREIHPELQHLAVGEVIPATPRGDDGFEVLRVDPPNVLVLGGLFDPEAKKQLRFDAQRPERFWHMTWAFVLERIDASTTRLHVRARGAFSTSERLHASWIRPVHHLMERAQLENLKRRVEGALPRDDVRDVIEGAAGAATMSLAMITPFLRGARNHWGIDEQTASRIHPGDELVPEPLWGWTHGIEIDADADDVWPWVAQIGADRGGFYSYQWLENLAGCRLRNAETIHPEWAVREGDRLLLHPKMPPLPVVRVIKGRAFVAFAPPDERAHATGKPWVAASWLFFVETLGPGKCRLISRYRVSTSDDAATRLAFGPALIEPIGFAMDRRMLLGVKERVAEASTHPH